MDSGAELVMKVNGESQFGLLAGHLLLQYFCYSFASNCYYIVEEALHSPFPYGHSIRF